MSAEPRARRPCAIWAAQFRAPGMLHPLRAAPGQAQDAAPRRPPPDRVGGRTVRSRMGGNQGGGRAGSTRVSPRNARRGQPGAEAQRPLRAVVKLCEKFEARGSEPSESLCQPRAQLSLSRQAELETCCVPPQATIGTGVGAFQSTSDRLDLASSGNGAGALPALAPGGEGEPHSQSPDALLGSADKEQKAGAAVTSSSAGTAPVASWPREARVETMDSACGSRAQLPRPCRVLVLLNPRGGKGKALQLFQSRVQPLLAEAEVSFKLMLTERKNHAKELVCVEELSRWDALVVMSGDGLIHEVVNGLMERPDWEIAIQKPLCSLPGGSGNALAASLNYYAGYEQVTNEDLLINCTLLLCRRRLSPMNLLSIHTASGLHLYSVLSLAWGFIADVDLESEKYRRLGEMRFTVGTFFRLAALRIYQGQLAYLPVGSMVSKMPTSAQLVHRGPVDTHLVPLGEPVPSHWTVVPHQDFVLVLVLLHTHLSSEMFTAPMGRCAAGVMHLFYVRAGVSRAMLLRLFLAMQKGKHMECDCPYLVHVPVVAFRLEPKNQRGVFSVDGEVMMCEAVQGQVHPDYFWMVSSSRDAPPSWETQQRPPLEKPL